MPMSPRLLRPRATGFDPRSISGCICNLDASVLSSLRQNSDGTTAAAATNDPIGYVQDLSGMGNHARQSVATGSRPSLRLNNQNGRPGLLFDGSNDWLTASVAGFQSLQNVTIIQVFKTAAAAAADTNSAAFWGFGNFAAAGGSFPALSAIGTNSSTGALSGERIAFALDPNGTTGRLGASGYLRPASTAQLLAVTAGSGGTALYSNNSQVSLDLATGVTTTTASGPSNTGYTLDNDLHICAIRANATIVVSPEITLHQMIVYNRVLTAAELTTIWNAMRVKWGITPYAPPTYADADVNAYITAVEAADGGVALETGVRDAINTFITGCKADGIWSSIKASCILMGARTLSGALTPLVGPSPTNNGPFVSGDYNRKTGLVGDGTTKFLNSNRANNVSGQNDRHSSVYVTTLPASGGVVLGAGSNGTGSTNMGRGGADGTAFFARSVPLSSTLGGDPTVNNSYNHSVAVNTGFWGLRRASGTEFFLRAQGVTDLVTATGAAVSGTPSSDNLFIFARNNGSGTANAISAARLAWYSLGDSLDLSLLDGRVTTLYNAIGAAIP